MRERLIEPVSRPLPDAISDTPPIIRRTELVAFALMGLLLIATVAVLYVARAFFLPVVTAVVIGTMLSPAAKWLEKYSVPRPVSAVMIVTLTCTSVVLMIGLISAPLMEWTKRLPELGSILKDKMHVFDQPLAIWGQLRGLFGSYAETDTPLQFPRIEWVQPTLEFISPTLTEMLLFFAVLVLFIASWPDLRRALVMNFSDHDARLRTLKILNSMESNLGNYLLTVTLINMGVGVATGIVCALNGLPNPAGLGGLAATLNFIPIIGPILMFFVLIAVGLITASTLTGALAGPLCFAGVAFLEGHFVTPTIIGRRLSLNALAVFLALAFWTWLWGPMGAFLSSPLLIVGLILKEHLTPSNEPQIPSD